MARLYYGPAAMLLDGALVPGLIRPQAEVELICRLRSSHGAPEGRIHGCYVPADRLIVSTADPYVLMHEFKHYFEGPWHK
jgi:hypothetical protein